jgi:hypothetical protein
VSSTLEGGALLAGGGGGLASCGGWARRLPDRIFPGFFFVQKLTLRPHARPPVPPALHNLERYVSNLLNSARRVPNAVNGP